MVVRRSCLPQKTYSQEQQRRAAAELDALPADSTLAGFIVDYGNMREQNRACREGR